MSCAVRNAEQFLIINQQCKGSWRAREQFSEDNCAKHFIRHALAGSPSLAEGLDAGIALASPINNQRTQKKLLKRAS